MTHQTARNAQAALVRAAASFVRDTYSGEWADDAAATLETDADLIERGEPCSLLRLAETMQPAAVSAAVAPPTQAASSLRAGLRDEIVKALGRITTVPPVAHRREQADHVLAVLYREWPWLRAEAEDAEPTDRATVLREAAQRLYTGLFPAVYADMGQKAAEGVNRAVSELRRMADETATTETHAEDPARIDRLRPEFTEHASVESIDAQLRRARAQQRRWHLRAEWLIGLRQARTEQQQRGEWPAAGARQDGAQP